MDRIIWLLSIIFYCVLCIFSIVTGIIYMSGKRKLNPLELSDKFVKKIKDMDKFTKRMGLVTFIVGIAQGVSAFGLYKISYLTYFSLAFTIFSFISAFTKLWNKWSTFAFLKLICYSLILCLFVFWIIGGK